MSTTACFRRLVSALSPLLLLFVSLAPPVQAQSITLSVTSSPQPVELSGTHEILGRIRLTAGSASGPMTTQISTLQTWYPGVSIVNTFPGQLSPNPATGAIVHPEGIVITFTGGYNHASVTASVFNSTAG